MIINVGFIVLWLTTRNNKNIKRGWRTAWKWIGIVNVALLLWSGTILGIIYLNTQY